MTALSIYYKIILLIHLPNQVQFKKIFKIIEAKLSASEDLLEITKILPSGIDENSDNSKNT